MIIHTYLTDGFYPWAELFLESLRFHHPDIEVIMSTRNLTKEQIKKLRKYKKITVENEELSVQKLAKRINMKPAQLQKYKNEIEKVCVNEKNKVWKLLISGDDRIKSLYKVMKKLDKGTYVLHSDIDMYVRKPLHDLFKIIEKNDISMRFRLHSKLNRKVLGSLQGFKVNPKIIEFMERWIYHIDKVQPIQRPLGFGQTTCYYAYKDLEKELQWGDLSVRFASPHMRDGDVIRSGNTKKGKTKMLKSYKQDFEKMKKRKNNGNK